MVMPEIGFAEDPIWPVTREDTVAKKNPNSTIRIAPSRLTPTCGSRVSTIARAIDPPTVREIGRSSSVRSRVTACPSRESRRSLRLEANELRIVRSEEHTSELQSRSDLVCRLLLEKKKTYQRHYHLSPKSIDASRMSCSDN